MLPAHETKHMSLLTVPNLGSTSASGRLSSEKRVFELQQRAQGDTNGTALWLGGQLLSAYLFHLYATKKLSRVNSAIELGAGIGLCGLTLAGLGINVLATDVHPVLDLLQENITRNAGPGSLPGGLIVKELDWTVSPEQWKWHHPTTVTSVGKSPDIDQGASFDSTDDLKVQHPEPPFDLILTADTLYHTALITPLLRSLKHLATSSTVGRSAPRCLVALERRDPPLITAALEEARDSWGFKCERVPQRKIVKAMERAEMRWKKEDWEGVEIWELSLQPDTKKCPANTESV